MLFYQFVGIFRVPTLCPGDVFPLKIDVLTEEIFCGAWVEKIVFRFLNDIGRIDEKEEVAVAFLIEVKDQASHNERFTAAGRHVEQQV